MRIHIYMNEGYVATIHWLRTRTSFWRAEHQRAHTPTHTSACTRAHPHMRMHTRARARTHTHTHIYTCTHAHSCPVLSSHCHNGCVGLEGTGERIGERSPIDTHTRTHTHVHNTCKYTRGSLLQENHTSSHVGMNCIHSWSYCLGHMREEQESECVTQTQCASTC